MTVRGRFRRIGVPLCLVAVGLALWWFWPRVFHAPKMADGAEQPAFASPSPSAPPAPPPAAASTSPASAPPSAAASDVQGRLQRIIDTLRSLPPGARREQVAALLRELDTVPAVARSDALVAFLQSGLDVELPGDFVLGPGGWLRDWPSLRLALFDYLAQRDRAAAVFLARDILTASATAPDEWALALRELGRGVPAAQWPPQVGRRLVDLLRHDTWAATAPRAYLEAFDLIVSGRAIPLLSELDRLARNAGPATRFAAFLAADRLTLAAPGSTLAELNRRPQLFADQAALRAGLFARADVRDPSQRAALESYLLRNDVGGEERQAFASLFPHYDLAVSHNLLTPPPRRALADMQAHDRAALTLIASWRARPDLARWSGAWSEISSRLAQQLPPEGGQR